LNTKTQLSREGAGRMFAQIFASSGAFPDGEADGSYVFGSFVLEKQRSTGSQLLAI